MNPDVIKQNIMEQVEKINLSFANHLALMFNGILSGNIEALDGVLKKVTRAFKFYYIIAMISAGFLIVISVLHIADADNSLNWNINLNKAGLVILFTIVFLLNAYRYYRIKVSIENKIYLQKLLNIIDNE